MNKNDTDKNEILSVDPAVDPAADRLLRIAIERAVRPIRAAELRKLQTRRELYAHACDAYHSELKRGLTPEAAGKRALDRLGDSAELSEELQQAIPRADRYAIFVERILRRQPTTPRWRHGLWMSGVGASYIGVLLALPVIGVLFGAPPEGFMQKGVFLRFVLFMLLMFGVNLGVGSYVGSCVRDALTSAGSRRLLRASARAVVGGFAIWVIGMLLWIVVAFPGIGWPRQYVMSWSLLALFYTVAVVGVSMLDIRERRELEEEWLTIEID